MRMIKDMLELMGMMFLLMLVGAFLRKKEFITKAGKKCLTDIILYVILPCNIIKAFCLELDGGVARNLIVALVVSIGIQIFYMVLNRTIYERMSDGEKQVYQYGTICSNAGFMGNPLTQGVFGDEGLLYCSVFLIPQRIMMWTAGVTYFTADGDKKGLMKKVLLHPCMIAVYIGLLIMLTPFELPGVLMRTVSSFSSCCTAMTMMYVGTILSDVDFKSLFTGKQLYFAFIRLIFCPLAVLLVCHIFHVDRLVTAVSAFLTAMPAGSTTSLLAAKYGADEEAAAKSVVLTTALSVFTLSIWSVLLLHYVGV